MQLEENNIPISVSIAKTENNYAQLEENKLPHQHFVTSTASWFSNLNVLGDYFCSAWALAATFNQLLVKCATLCAVASLITAYHVQFKYHIYLKFLYLFMWFCVLLTLCWWSPLIFSLGIFICLYFSVDNLIR